MAGAATPLNALVLGIEVIVVEGVSAAATVTCGVLGADGAVADAAAGVAADGELGASLAAVSVVGFTAAAVFSGFFVDGLLVTAWAAADGSLAAVPAFGAVADRLLVSAFARRLRAGFASLSVSAVASAEASVSEAALVSDAALGAVASAAAAASFFLFLAFFCAGGFLGCAGADEDEADSESADGVALAIVALPSSAALTPTAATPVPSHVDTANFLGCERRCAPGISDPPESRRAAIRPRQITHCCGITA